MSCSFLAHKSLLCARQRDSGTCSNYINIGVCKHKYAHTHTKHSWVPRQTNMSLCGCRGARKHTHLHTSQSVRRSCKLVFCPPWVLRQLICQLRLLAEWVHGRASLHWLFVTEQDVFNQRKSLSTRKIQDAFYVLLPNCTCTNGGLTSMQRLSHLWI